MKKFFIASNLLWAILILAFLLRIWNVGNQEIFGDESAYAFRSIGYLDYLGSSFQTQPIDWYKNQELPKWTKLSFHDHPPLVFIIQNLFFKVFGDSILAARLPAVLFGTLSTFLIYLLVKMLFQDRERLALLAAFLFAVNGTMVWIFRTALMEPLLIFLIILNILCFWKFLKDRRYWWVFGLTLGLVALTKYNGVFLLPVYFSYLIIDWKKFGSVFKDWRFYGAFLIAVIVFSPVIAYNIFLYKATGHFDVQISYLLGQATPEWTVLIGKLQAPFSDFWKNLIYTKTEASGTFFPVVSYGYLFAALVLAGLIFTFFDAYRSRGALPQPIPKIKKISDVSFNSYAFIWLYFVFLTLLLVKIGSAHRFLAMYGPIAVILIALFLDFLCGFVKTSKWNLAFRFLAIAFLLFEISRSIYMNYAYFGSVYDYGVIKLDQYLTEELRGTKSAVIPEADNRHLTEIINKFSKRKLPNAEPRFTLMVYNDNVVLTTLQWIFYRRFFYQNIPTLYVQNFESVLDYRGPDYLDRFQIYFIQSTSNTFLNKFKLDETAGNDLESRLRAAGLEPVKIIYGHDGLAMFRVYKFKIKNYLSVFKPRQLERNQQGVIVL
jgi:4-amino-4-deoxy-L-arabinose transferase-like glycosyltransferase